MLRHDSSFHIMFLRFTMHEFKLIELQCSADRYEKQKNMKF